MSRQNFKLKIGESAQVRNRFFSQYTITYAGMPSESAYSIVVSWTSSYNSAAYNLFFSDKHREFHAAKGRVTVSRVSPDEIEFGYQSK